MHPGRHLLPCLLESSKAYQIKMLHIDHRLLARGIHRRMRRLQEPRSLHRKPFLPLVPFTDPLPVLQRPDQLDHMPVVLMLARPFKDPLPPRIRHFGLMGEEPVDVGAGAAHAGPEEEEHVASRFNEVGFLGAGERGFREEDGVPEAGVRAVDKEEVIAGLVRRALGGGGDVD